MPVKSLVKLSEYHDSVSLMLVAQELSRLPGVTDVAVIMATEANKAILQDAGLLTPEADAASPNDLVIAVSAAQDILETALVAAEKLLQQKASHTQSGPFRPRTLSAAIKSDPDANLAVISVSGRYAADQAWDALRRGLHVLLFSDNVSLEDEIALKQFAHAHGLLLMGPGAGTAILNGVALGFANVLPSGPVGIVSAAGTGLQEVSCLLARYGVGITQGIGTGGRDLKEEVGGIMMLDGLAALQHDPATRVILLVSKPPSPQAARKVIDQAARSSKPTVLCYLGADLSLSAIDQPNVWIIPTLQEAALFAAHLAGANIMDVHALLRDEQRRLVQQAAELKQRLHPGQRFLRGLYSGGTLCYEAQAIWRQQLEVPVYSNAPLDRANQLPDSTQSLAHTAVDLGEEEFTVGRLHPMIDNDLRIRRLLQEVQDPTVAVILMDVVIGYGAHPDPASELAPAIRKARLQAAEKGRQIVFIASVTGTEADPQRLSRQVQGLQDAGVVLCASNAAAARLAALIVQGGYEPS